MMHREYVIHTEELESNKQDIGSDGNITSLSKNLGITETMHGKKQQAQFILAKQPAGCSNFSH